ncbi:hypothetical protein PHYSODRAFT_288825 [Phytophthora sojae]|uniref:Uncharacterized protein n=1 Tax=Phytophthora sojae (strain P6497) TaxID=1094619 RepID=G5A8P7_PHYSP|nr:hypothetical protein PHYSODRAFT_288825 [Phytophthora sojae]EGZ08273.1 hypothetical protein PHYSODRAFT_288825 [Phytophthora sojae]|eukprot:XP_009536445.1 hypothetical protein PHYSODRAFT_288825 [Phytophthora sojae]
MYPVKHRAEYANFSLIPEFDGSRASVCQGSPPRISGPLAFLGGILPREPRKEHGGCSDGLRVTMADDGSRHKSSSRATTAIALQEGGDSMGRCHGGGRPRLRPLFQARGRRPRFKHSSRLHGAHASFSTRRTNAINAQVKSPWDSGRRPHNRRFMAPVLYLPTSWVASTNHLTSLEVALCTNFQTLPPDSGPESPLPSDALHR